MCRYLLFAVSGMVFACWFSQSAFWFLEYSFAVPSYLLAPRNAYASRDDHRNTWMVVALNL